QDPQPAPPRTAPSPNKPRHRLASSVYSPLLSRFRAVNYFESSQENVELIKSKRR
ncbi:unnamed protein product, partial [Laminaria digitata]